MIYLKDIEHQGHKLRVVAMFDAQSDSFVVSYKSGTIPIRSHGIYRHDLAAHVNRITTTFCAAADDLSRLEKNAAALLCTLGFHEARAEDGPIEELPSVRQPKPDRRGPPTAEHDPWLPGGL
jgi:hypothetical protein